MKKEEQSTHKYDDIIHLTHPEPQGHPRMSLYDRAAQFAPFAALSGHEDQVKETARLTERKIELDENEIDILDEKLRDLKAMLGEQPQVTVVYFQPDTKKQGGSYLTISGIVKKIDEFTRRIVFQDGRETEIGQILDIDYRD